MNNYCFQPLHWIDPNCPNRLSTCRGKHIEQEFGCMTRQQLLSHFEGLCVFDVVMRDSRKKNLTYTSLPIRQWAAQNIHGFWMEFCYFNQQDMFISKKARKYRLNLFDFCYSFQLKDDCHLFDMVWS